MKFSAVFALCCIVLLLAANIEARDAPEIASFTDFTTGVHEKIKIKGLAKLIKSAPALIKKGPGFLADVADAGSSPAAQLAIDTIIDKTKKHH